MDLRHLGSIALLAVMAVAALFFFPAAHGSYSSTHGPITAVRSLRLRAILFFVIAAAAAVLKAILHSLRSIARGCEEPLFAPDLSPASISAPLRR